MTRARALRPATRFRAPTAALVVAALLGPGCGSGDPPEPDPRPVETAEKPVELPDGWNRHVNSAGGFELGLPPGWEARERGTTTQIRSFDELVVISIAPDRTSEALEYDLGDFASRTLASLEGYKGNLEPGDPRPYKHHYDGAKVEAEATSSASGVKQNVVVIILRRPKLALFTVVVQANAGSEARPAEELADRAIKTLRSVPLS